MNNSFQRTLKQRYCNDQGPKLSKLSAEVSRTKERSFTNSKNTVLTQPHVILQIV